MIHKNITVEGRVQGVWFRAETKKKARALGITGFVKNQIDGTVYIEAEGSTDQINTFIAWCHNGPPLAHVATLSEQSGDVKRFTTFEIR